VVGDAGRYDALSLKYEQTLKVLDRQGAVLRELRDRASIVLAATGIVAGLLGDHALKDPHPLSLAILALAALAAGIVCCLGVLRAARDVGPLKDGSGAVVFADTRPCPRWPSTRRRKWKLTLTSREIDELAQAGDASDCRHQIVVKMSAAREENHRTINKRNWALVAAGALLIIQIGLWATLLIINTGHA
jgi:hypothetical protein